jgi:enoyl-CoA hydratase
MAAFSLRRSTIRRTTSFLCDSSRTSTALRVPPTGDLSVGAVILTGPGQKFVSHSEPEQVSQFFEMSAPPIPSRLAQWSIKTNNAAMRLPKVMALTEKRGGLWGSGIVYSALLKRTVTRMNRSGVAYIAAINGAALGGGFELALFCDLRIAADSEHVRIGLIEILAGLIPGGGGSQRLPVIIGMAAALEHMLDGRPLSAREALAAGIVRRVVPGDRLLPDAQATAGRIACRTPYAVSALKRAVYFGGHRSLSAALDFELACFISTGRNPKKRVIATASVTTSSGSAIARSLPTSSLGSMGLALSAAEPHDHSWLLRSQACDTGGEKDAPNPGQ